MVSGSAYLHIFICSASHCLLVGAFNSFTFKVIIDNYDPITTFLNVMVYFLQVSFPGGSDGKESAYSAEDLGSIPGSGRSCGEGNGNPLQYSCLESPMDRGAWLATVHGVTKCQT